MQDQVIVITGASQGIGAAAARIFAQAGAKVALLARSDCTGLVGEIGSERAMALRCDVADWDQVAAAHAVVLARWGRVDVWINNAGAIDPMSRIEAADPLAWSAGIDINLKGVFHGFRAALGGMKARGGGTIITVSSGAATSPIEGWSAYCAGKAGALMLTRSLHLEEHAQGIRALGLSPGTVATQMQVKIKASGIGPVAALDPSVHIPADWPARTLLWMCTSAADPWLGTDVSLRDPAVRRAVGLVA